MSGEVTFAKDRDGDGLALLLGALLFEQELQVFEGVGEVGFGHLVELHVERKADVKGVEQFDEVVARNGAVGVGHFGVKVADVRLGKVAENALLANGC